MLENIFRNIKIPTKFVRSLKKLTQNPTILKNILIFVTSLSRKRLENLENGRN